MVARLLRRPVTWVVLAVLGVGAVLGLYWFQPWKLVTDRTVTETLSAPVSSASPTAGPTVLATGAFVTHEHDTTGDARIVRAADGTHTLELVGLDTSNGPDLRVWLTDQPVLNGSKGWRVFDDGEWLELGRLKGNRGDQAYAIPAGVDPDDFRSVAIWCKRFSVSFGAAPLA